MPVRVGTVTFVRLLCLAVVLMSVGCASMSLFRGSDETAPEFTFHTPSSNELVSDDVPRLVSVDFSDRGRGVDLERVWFVVIPPKGEPLRFEDPEDFFKRSSTNAAIMLEPPMGGVLESGTWVVNIYVDDSAGNLATMTWAFSVTKMAKQPR